jgi:predicted nuclease of restriction endonuclease-like RecB superfamily
VLGREWHSEERSPVAPREARARLFTAAAAEGRQVGPAVAAEIGLTHAELMGALFADLRGERIVTPPDSLMSPEELAQRCNLALVQGLLERSAAVSVGLRGDAQAIVRLARRRGLICQVGASPDHELLLELSGPLVLFRGTLLYGRALGALVGGLGSCDRFELRATCILRGRQLSLALRTGDPISPPLSSRGLDGKLELRFMRDFLGLTLDWDVLADPAPVGVDGTWIFPDFAIVHRDNPARRWLLEVAGFWTPDYVRQRLALLEASRLDRLILCVDRDRNCSPDELPEHPRVIPYKRRVDAAAVLAILDGG